jgi:hypothetical protein
MECRLLFSKFKNETTICRIQEKFARIPKGRSTHQADAFKLGLQAALVLKKRESLVGTGDVPLRCPAPDCPGTNSYTSYPQEGIANNEYCQPCYNAGQRRSGRLRRRSKR